MDNRVLYTAHKSALEHGGWFVAALVLAVLGVGAIAAGVAAGFAFIIVGIVLILVGALIMFLVFFVAKKYEVVFYADRIVVRHGIISVHESQAVMTPIIGVRLEQGIIQRMVNAGDIIVDKVGKGWDLDLTWIHDPASLKRYLESLISSTDYSSVGKFVSQ